jgi:hypothetical protein
MDLEPTSLFTTREVLKYGTRGSVDQCLYRFVKSGFITRVARGVFVRDPRKNPTVAEIVEVKMAAFGKQVLRHATIVLRELGKNTLKEGRQRLFAVNGHSTSFETWKGTATLTGIGPRKAKLCESQVGELSYALWDAGNVGKTASIIQKVFGRFDRATREALRQASSLLPAWLHHLCRWAYCKSKVT